MERYPGIPHRNVPPGSWNDPVRCEGRKALARTIINGAIAAGDLVPWTGDSVSVAADIAKVTHRGARMLSRVPGFRGLAKGTGILDLTPDVNVLTAFGSELAEPVTGGLAPTHVIEASLQYFGHDKERIQAGRAARNAYRRRH